MAAGKAAMEAYTGDEVKRINALGERLREGCNHAFQQAGIKGQALGMGSLTNLHIASNGVLHDARDSIAGMIAAGHIPRLLHLCMLRRGVASASRLMFCVSTAMGESEIAQAITALHESLAELGPYVASERPLLVA